MKNQYLYYRVSTINYYSDSKVPGRFHPHDITATFYSPAPFIVHFKNITMKTVSIKQNMESHALAFQQGDHEGITILFDAWYPSLCNYIHSLIHDQPTAEEIASEAFVKTWQYRRQLESADEIRAYLFTIARRDAYRLLQERQKSRQVLIPGQLLLTTSQLPEIMQTELNEVITDAIHTLPPRCRQIFELLYKEGLDTSEIARELVISPYTVRAQKARAINLLRPKLLPVLSEKA